MTREEAIEILWQYDVNFEPHPAEKVMHAIDMAIEALQREEAEEKGYCHRIKPKEYFSADAKWIPCSERLPRTGDDILVTYSDGEVDIIWSARPKTWVKYEEANNLIFPVAWMPLPIFPVAWMPLPKPYREDGEEE